MDVIEMLVITVIFSSTYPNNDETIKNLLSIHMLSIVLRIHFFLYFQNAIEKKKQYLATAENNRVQYENSMKQINDWLHGAEILTDSGYDTLDLETISCTLKEHQVVEQ